MNFVKLVHRTLGFFAITIAAIICVYIGWIFIILFFERPMISATTILSGNFGSFHTVQPGMTEEQVKSIMGEPFGIFQDRDVIYCWTYTKLKIDALKYIFTWYPSRICFDYDRKVKWVIDTRNNFD